MVKGSGDDNVAPAYRIVAPVILPGLQHVRENRRYKDAAHQQNEGMRESNEIASAFERRPAIGRTLLHFSDSIRAVVLVLDVGRYFQLMVPQISKHFLDGRVALSERHVGALIAFA